MVFRGVQSVCIQFNSLIYSQTLNKFKPYTADGSVKVDHVEFAEIFLFKRIHASIWRFWS